MAWGEHSQLPARGEGPPPEPLPGAALGSQKLHRASESDLELSVFCPQGSTGSSPSPGRRLLITQQRRKVRVCPPPDSAQLSHWRCGHPLAILSSHTCARPSVHACVCACVWVCTSAGLQLCLRVCTRVTALSRTPEYVHECTRTRTPVCKHGYTLVRVHVCIRVPRSPCACLPVSMCACVGKHIHVSMCAHICVRVCIHFCVWGPVCVCPCLCAHTCECCIFSLGQSRWLWQFNTAVKVDTKTGPGEGVGPAPSTPTHRGLGQAKSAGRRLPGLNC